MGTPKSSILDQFSRIFPYKPAILRYPPIFQHSTTIWEPIQEKRAAPLARDSCPAAASPQPRSSRDGLELWEINGKFSRWLVGDMFYFWIVIVHPIFPWEFSHAPQTVLLPLWWTPLKNDLYIVEFEMAWNHKSVDILDINLAQDHRDPRNRNGKTLCAFEGFGGTFT